MLPSFASTKELLEDKSSGSLMCSAEDVNAFLHNTLSNPERDHKLEPHKALISLQPPVVCVCHKGALLDGG